MAPVPGLPPKVECQRRNEIVLLFGKQIVLDCEVFSGINRSEWKLGLAVVMFLIHTCKSLNVMDQ